MTPYEMWRSKETPKKLSRKYAIRMKCRECTGDQQIEIRECPVWSCPLWPYRLGRVLDPPPAWSPE